PRKPRNLAARVGRWSATHRRSAILGWLAFVVAAFAIGAALQMRTIEPQNRDVGEAGKAARIVADAFPKEKDQLGEFVIGESRTLTADDPAFRATIDDTLRTLRGFEQVQRLHSPLAPRNAGQIAPDRHAVLISFSPRGDLAAASLYIDDITTAV